MALHWDLTEPVERGLEEQYPDHVDDDGNRHWNPVTHALIWATIGVDMGSITHKNADEFLARIRLLEHMVGHFAHEPNTLRADLQQVLDDAPIATALDTQIMELLDQHLEGSKPTTGVPITAGDVWAHRGLRTNVATLTRKDWLAKLGERGALRHLMEAAQSEMHQGPQADYVPDKIEELEADLDDLDAQARELENAGDWEALGQLEEEVCDVDAELGRLQRDKAAKEGKKG